MGTENVFHTCGILIWQPNTAEISVLAKGQLGPTLLLHDLLIIGLLNITEAIALSVAARRCFSLASLYPVPLTPAFTTCITNAGRRPGNTRHMQ